jgi:hypothetical protein
MRSIHHLAGVQRRERREGVGAVRSLNESCLHNKIIIECILADAL